MRTPHHSRRLLLGAVVVGAVLLVPVVAGASVSGPCDGSVTIGGVTYTPANDTAANPIVVPDQPGLIASWQGTTGPPITDFAGDVGVVVGPFTVVIADWSGPNEDEETSSSGDYAVDEARGLVPVGLYEMTATHTGTGGTCTGTVMVLIEGNPLTTPVGAGAAVGTLATGLGLVAAGRGRKA